MHRSIALSLSCAALLLPSLASAQQYIVSTLPSTYQALPLNGGTSTPITTSSTDDGAATNVALPFPLLYFGNTYNSINIGTNVFATFGSNSATSLSNQVLPSSTTPNDLIAVWWDDNFCDQGNITTQTLGQPGGREFVIQWHCRDLSSTSATIQAQLWLTEGSTVIRVKYGALGPGGSFTTSMGIENSGGTVGLQGYGPLGITCGSSCDYDDWPANTTIQYGVSVEPDLQPQVALGPMVTVGTNVSFPVNTTIRNLGQNAGTNVIYDVYLSSDAVLDPVSDTLLVAHTNGETVPGQGNATFTDPVSMPRPPNGQYWVCADIDPLNTITESNEGNNRGCMPAPFLIGSDLFGSISMPATGAPGENVPFSIQIRNQGSDATGAFTYRIWFSPDPDLHPGLDTPVYTGNLSLQGTDAFIGTVSGFVPANISGNQFFAILEIDPVSPAFPSGVVTEAIETNNKPVSSSKITLIKPDLRMDVASYQTETALGCFFEEPVTVTYRICNQGGGNAWGFVNSVLFSKNIVITAPNPPQGDPEADTIPAACLSEDAECGSAAGPGFCHLGICHNTCSTNADCTDGMVCAAERGDLAFVGLTCQNHLAPGACKTYTRSFTVPLSNPFTGEDYVEQEEGFFFGVITDSSTTVNEEIEENNKLAIEPAALCRFPSPDLIAVTAIPPERMAAGETAAIFRSIRNLGNRATQAGYRYILSTNESPSANDIPLLLQSTGTDGILDVERNSESQATDLVRVPSHVASGDYYLGLIVDPTDAVVELSNDNNTFVTATRVHVDNSALRIVTTNLPDATVGAVYNRQLIAVGGAGAYVWSADPGELPPGITLSADGFLSGTPLDEGAWSFTVNVSSGGVSASAMLGLRVGPPMGALGITTPSPLPPAVANKAYFLRLSAAGGHPPYKWYRDSGELPRTLVVNEVEGTISGLPITPGSSSFTLRVEDSIGNKAYKDFTMTVVENDDLFITSQNFQEATAGEEFSGGDACVRAQGGSGQYTWTMEASTLPDGVTYETRDNRGCLVGTPRVCDNFNIGVRVEDNVTGQSDSANLRLTIVCSRVGLTTKRLDDVRRSVTVDEQLEANAGQDPTFRIFGGRLPAGLQLGTTGQLSGVVADDAAYGTYNFVVEVSDAEGGYGLSALSITVLADLVELQKEKKDDGGGCSTASDGASGFLPFGLALIGLAAAGFRRRMAAPR